jgi:hypothetical protein
MIPPFAPLWKSSQEPKILKPAPQGEQTSEYQVERRGKNRDSEGTNRDIEHIDDCPMPVAAL